MADEFRLDIVTPHGVEVSEMVTSLQYRGPLGVTTIMKDHAPMMTVFDIGAVHYVLGGKQYHVAVSEGYLEIEKNVAILLTNTMEYPEEIDVDRAKRAEQRAQDRLDGKVPDVKPASSVRALKRARNRQRVASMRDDN